MLKVLLSPLATDAETEPQTLGSAFVGLFCDKTRLISPRTGRRRGSLTFPDANVPAVFEAGRGVSWAGWSARETPSPVFGVSNGAAASTANMNVKQD
jgi:hypothetical protein